jgi:hypothetical protein
MLAFTSVYFFELRLFNGLRPFGIKNLLARFRRSGSARNASHRLVSPLRTWEKSGLSSGKYTEKSPTRQEFVDRNRREAVETLKFAKDLESGESKRGGL